MSRRQRTLPVVFTIDEWADSMSRSGHGVSGVLSSAFRYSDTKVASGPKPHDQFADSPRCLLAISDAVDSIYSPKRGYIAFIRISGTAQYATIADLNGANKRRLGPGTQVDWQPVCDVPVRPARIIYIALAVGHAAITFCTMSCAASR
jgi:hypothetical protein